METYHLKCPVICFAFFFQYVMKIYSYNYGKAYLILLSHLHLKCCNKGAKNQ